MAGVNRFTIILRSLWYRRLGVLGLILAMAVAAAAVAGGLIVGDSMRASMRAMLLSRLAGAEVAVVAASAFDASLADELLRLDGRLPADELSKPGARVQRLLRLGGVLQRDESSPVMGGFTLLGVDTPVGLQAGGWLSTREVGITPGLAKELGLADGQDVLVGTARSGGGDDTLFSNRRSDRLVRTLRRTVRIIVAEPLAHLSLEATQASPQNLLLQRKSLADLAGASDVANLLLLWPPAGSSLSAQQVRQSLAAAARLGDVGLQRRGMYLQGADFILSPGTVRAVKEAAAKQAGSLQETSAYLSDRLTTAAGRQASYAVIASGAGDELGENEISLNSWLADDLGATAGERVSLEYLLPRADGTFARQSVNLEVKAIVPVDRPEASELLPQIPGISDAQSVDAWEAPFPVEMVRVTPRDEEYWKAYRTTPKAFVSPVLLQRIWQQAGASGWITGLRVHEPEADALQREIVADLLSAGEGLWVREVRREALAASEGSSDFGSLFAGMSVFLIISAAAISLTLARLGLEARGREIGILQACGFSRRQLSGLLAAELAGVALLATAVGMVLSVVYARLLLRLFAAQAEMPWELPPLRVDIQSASLAAAALCCLAMGAVAFLQTQRFIGRLTVTQLLGLRGETPCAAAEPHRAGMVISGMLAAAAVVSMLLPRWMQGFSPAAAFLPAGGLLLAALLVLMRQLLSHRRTAGGLGTASLMLSSLAGRRGSSLLTASLFAVAAFMLTSVAMYRASGGEAATGGFALRVTCAVPPGYDPATAAGRGKLGFETRDEAALAGAAIVPLWRQGTGDVSCLNMVRPNTARVLGADERLLSPGRFRVRLLGDGSVWQRLQGAPQQEAIAVIGDAQSMTWILKRSLGEVFELPRENGKPLRVQLVGLIEGGLFSGDLLMSRDAMARAYGQSGRPSVFMVRTTAAQAAAVQEALLRGLAAFGPQVEGVDAIIARVQSVQRLYMTFFILLGGAGLMLGGAGQVAVMVRQGFERRQEMSILLAQGFTRGRVARLLAVEQGTLLLAGLLAGALAALTPGLVLMDVAWAWGVLRILAVVALTGAGAIVIPLAVLIPRGDQVCLTAE